MPGTREGGAERGCVRWLVGALLVLMVVAAWSWRDGGYPPRGDEARHMTAVVRVTRGDWLFPDPGLTYPPLGYWVLAISGGDYERAPLAQGVFLAVFMGSLGWAGSRLGDRWTGLLAVALAAGSPLLNLVLRTGYVDLGLAAFCALALALLLRCEDRRTAFLAGAACGLAGLVKFGFLLFVAVPVAWAGWRYPRGMGWMAAGALVVAGPWYLAASRVFQRMADFLGGSFYVPAADPPGSSGAFAWVIWVAVDWLWGLPLTVAMLWALASRRDGVTAGLAACAFAPLLALALLPHRGPHYALPALAPSALLAARALRGRPVLLALVLLASAGALGVRPSGGDVLFRGFCTICPAGSLVGDLPLFLGFSRSTDGGLTASLVSSASARIAPLPPREAPLYARPGSERASTVALGGALPVDAEGFRYEAFRQGLRVRFGVLGEDIGPEDAEVLVLGPGVEVPPGFREVERREGVGLYGR